MVSLKLGSCQTDTAAPFRRRTGCRVVARKTRTRGVNPDRLGKRLGRREFLGSEPLRLGGWCFHVLCNSYRGANPTGSSGCRHGPRTSAGPASCRTGPELAQHVSDSKRNWHQENPDFRLSGGGNVDHQWLNIWDIFCLARVFHESPAATTDMVVLPGVLGCRTLRRTVQVRLGSNSLRLPGGTPISAVSQRKFMKHPG
jgi:hypothetical protein